jgi:hypothetical protein
MQGAALERREKQGARCSNTAAPDRASSPPRHYWPTILNL